MNRILLIGAGTMGRTHADAYAGMEHVQVDGVVDIRPERAKELADRLGARPYTSYEEAAAAERDVTVVDVCVPTDLHARFVRKAADGGKHVICEKPLDLTTEGARELVRYCGERGVRLFVGHVVRFFPEHALAKAQLDSGATGEVAVVRTSRCGPFPHGSDEWFADFNRSGGVVLDLMIHDLDYLRWCFGEVESVFARGTTGPDSGELQYVLAILRFKNGVMAHVEGSWAHASFFTRFEFAGKEGIIDFHSGEKPVLFQPRAKEAGSRGVAVPDSPLLQSPYGRELEHFLACIGDGSEPIVTAEDACEAVRISRAIIESVQTGRRIALDEFQVKGGVQG